MKGPFADRGVMLGASNLDGLVQALDLAKAGRLQWVAVAPGTPLRLVGLFHKVKCRVVVWQPPESAGWNTPAQLVAFYGAVGYIGQAEGPGQWAQAVNDVARSGVIHGIVCDDWRYGRFPTRCRALVEVYANAGPVDFGVFPNYLAQGANNVIAVPGVYPGSYMGDEEAAAIYATLPHGMPFCGFAGEDLITDACLRVLYP